MRMLGTLVARPEDRGEGQPHHHDREPVGHGQAPARLAAAAHVVGEVRPDAFAAAVDHVQGLTSSARVRRRQREDVGAVLDVGHRYAGQRTDDQMVPPELLAQGSQVAVIASPDEARPEHREVPAVLLGEAPCHPLLPPFGDSVAVAGVDVRRLVKRRVLVQGPTNRAVVVDRESCCTAPTVGRRWWPWHPSRRSVPTTVPANCASSPPETTAARWSSTSTPSKARAKLARRAQVGPEDLHRGGPAEPFQARGRTDHGADLDAPGQQCSDHVPAEEPIGAGDECPHGRCSLGLRASTIRLTSRTSLAVTGSADPSASAR